MAVKSFCSLRVPLLRQFKFVHIWNVIESRYSSGGRHRQEILSGIRVLDLSRILAGPYCSMILADMGAEVIKVEKPGFGDDTRTWGPPFCCTESAYFISVNRNKKSIVIDLKTEHGKDLIRKLACVSDVFLENYLPGKLSEFGLGYSELSKIAPHLIYCSITGYGQNGPYAKRPGYDVIVAGVGGLVHTTGPQNGEPCKAGVAMTDLSTGLYAHGAILAALLHRQNTGRGQYLDCNLLSTQVASLVNLGSNYLNAGKEATRQGTAHESIVPYQGFATSDGYILIGAGNDAQFKALCKLLGATELSKDERYKTNKLRVFNRKLLLSQLSDIFSQKNTTEWLKQFEGCEFPYGPINNMSQVFADQQVHECGLIQEMEHPQIGKIRLPAPAVDYVSQVVSTEHFAPPILGQHTQEVLRNVLGLGTAEINDLSKHGVIKCAS